MAASKPQTRNEEPEMRRIRNQRIHTSNPSLLFARGIESLVSDQLQRQGYREADEQHAKQAAGVKPQPRGNFFSLLMRQFASN
jgi:hypothetical protein